VSYKQTVER